MKRLRFQAPLIIFILSIVFGPALIASSQTVVQAQGPEPSPTPSVGTPPDMYVTVISTEPQINVRGGPSSVAYPIIGFLLQGTTAPALGRSPGGDWIQIAYGDAPGGIGLVYSPLVSVAAGTLRIVEPPPTPIPPPTNTIDPTLVAQFNSVATSTRLPTFTPPAASLVIPTFPESAPAHPKSDIPMGVMILGFGLIGFVGFLFSLVGRR